MHRRAMVLAMLFLVHGGAERAAAAAESSSAPAARALMQALRSSGEDAAAAEDPDAPGRFVAALRIGDRQLLVVSAQHPSPETVRWRIEHGEPREAYIDLQSTPIREGKMFVDDQGADGLDPDPARGTPFDTVYLDGVDRFTLDGEPKDHGLSKAEYRTRYQELDRRYRRMLEVLTGGTKAAPALHSTAAAATAAIETLQRRP